MSDYTTWQILRVAPGFSARVIWTLILGAFAALFLFGCTPQKMIDAEAVAPLFEKVADRHDAYVLADESLEPIESETYLESSALLRATIDAALGVDPIEDFDPGEPPE